MRRFNQQAEATRDIERAKVSRWFASTDLGLVFFDEDERGIMITQDEYDRWLDEALAGVEDFMRHYKRMPAYAVAASAALFAGSSLIAPLLSMVGLTDTVAYAIPLLGCMMPFVVYGQFRARQTALRRKFASKILLRPRLERAENERKRRFNIVRIVQAAAGLGAFAIGVYECGAGLEDPGSRLDSRNWWIVGGLILVALLAQWAADRIDGVHRRRLREWWRF